MSQKVRIDGVRHAGASVFLGIDRCGNPCWTRNPERIMVWLCDGWRSRFNQRRAVSRRINLIESDYSDDELRLLDGWSAPPAAMWRLKARGMEL